MSKEKLIEEIYQELSCVSWGFHRKDAEEIITRVGRAYADGMELPGEISRVRWGNAVIIRMALSKEEEK